MFRSVEQALFGWAVVGRVCVKFLGTSVGDDESAEGTSRTSAVAPPVLPTATFCSSPLGGGDEGRP